MEILYKQIDYGLLLWMKSPLPEIFLYELDILFNIWHCWFEKLHAWKQIEGIRLMKGGKFWKGGNSLPS